MTQLTALLALPFFLGLYIYAPQLVPALFGEQWMTSVPVMQVLAFIGIIHCILRPMIAVIVGMGRPDWRLRLQLVDAVANVVGFLIAVQWGIVAVAISYVIVGYIQVPLWYRAVKKLIDISMIDYLKTLFGPLAASGAMILAIIALKYVLPDVVPVFVQLAAGALVGAIVYSVSIFIISPDTAFSVINILKTFLPQQKKLKT